VLIGRFRTCDIVTTSTEKTTFCRTRLAKTLPKMKSLAELSITHRRDVDISGLRKTFQRYEVVLSTIVRLRILSHGSWSFLVEACPNVEMLALEYNMQHGDLLKAAGGLKQLKHLEMCSDTWRKVDIHYLHTIFPDIQSLALRGSLGHEHISTFADAFGLFKKLTDLSLTAVQ
jgi:hypothetical protein